jgi:peptidoglycan/LPS O-acetylase OafA/YrhL
MKATHKSWNYDPNIQVLRGISIVLVLLSHIFHWPRHAGTLGVTIFFAISGYLITSILITEYNKTGSINFLAFYKRRARRLLPLALLVIISTTGILSIQNAVGFEKWDLKWLLLSAITTSLYIGNFFGFMHLGYTDLHPALGHFWSLGVEEQFYLVWPAILILLLSKERIKEKLLKILIFLVLVSISLHSIFQLLNKDVWTLPTTYLDILLLGCATAIFPFDLKLLHKKPILFAAELLMIICLSLLVFTTINQKSLIGQGYTLIALTSFLIFVIVKNTNYFIVRRLFEPIGKYSYSLYCIHFPIIILLETNHGTSTKIKLISLMLTIVLSILSHEFFESIFWKPSYSRRGAKQ